MSAETDNEKKNDASKTDATQEEEKSSQQQNSNAQNDEKENESTFKLPSKMKAVVVTAYNEKDPISNIKIVDMDVPKPGPNEVLIKVFGASVNPVDYKIAQGWMQTFLRLKLPYVMGRDCAGIVVALGQGIDKYNNKMKNKNEKIERGTKVAAQVPNLGAKMGTWAEYIVLGVSNLTVIPQNSNINWIEAASIPLAGQTSYQALVDKGKLKKNNKVLILGGASGCGILGIQIAKAFGASVIATTSSQEEFCIKYGATKVYNYKKEKDDAKHCWYKDLKGQDFDIIYDCVGGKDTWEYAQTILHKNGRFVTIVGDVTHGEPTTLGRVLSEGLTMANRKFWSNFNNPTYDHFLMDTKRGLKELFELMKENKLKAVLDEDSPYTLDTLYDMLKKSMQHKAHGKLVIRFNQDGNGNGKTDTPNTQNTQNRQNDKNGHSEISNEMKRAANNDGKVVQENEKENENEKQAENEENGKESKDDKNEKNVNSDTGSIADDYEMVNGNEQAPTE